MAFRLAWYLTNGTDPLRKSEGDELSVKALRKYSEKHELADFTPTQSSGERSNPQAPVSIETIPLLGWMHKDVKA